MSTPILYHIFALRQVDYVKTELSGGIAVLHVRLKPNAIRCPTCHSKEVVLRGKKERRFRHIGTNFKRVDLVCQIPRVECTECGDLRQVKIPFADPYKRFTRPLGRQVLELCRHMTMQEVADYLDMSWDTVKEIEKEYLHRRFAFPKLKKLRRIAIDEIAVQKGHRYLTVVMDLESGAIVFVGDGKSADALKPFWRRLKASHAKIEAVAQDMSPAYALAVKENLPQAVMVYDRFHVMKLFNHYLTCLRRELYSQMKDKTLRDMLKGSRWLLLKNPENLNKDYNEPKRLEEALAANQSLATGYYLKESLREIFWNCRTYKEAEQFLDEWIADAKASNIRLMVDMAFTIERHRQGLLNYHLCPITTGPLEGTNNKIKTLKRQAYGYRDQEFFKLKILALHTCKYSLTG